jgi:ABC-type transporter Mla maintaining outer membrane lipid asymmetry permease subunit MlaE
MSDPGTRHTRRRRFAGALVRYAARVMPREQQHWADAMQNEMAYMTDDGEACRWAIGCVRAAHAVRLRALYLLDVAVVRYLGALLAAFLAFDSLFATALTLAYRLGAFGAAEQLGGMTAGDDYRRLIPLMEGIPVWAHVIAVAGGACYLAAVGCLLRRRRSAQIALLLAVGIHVVGNTLVQPIIAAIGIAAVPDPSFFAAVLLPAALPLLLALAAGSGSRTQGA